LFQYFSPSHSRLDATFSLVRGASVSSSCSASKLPGAERDDWVALDWGAGWPRRRCGGGGEGPPRITELIMPEDWRARRRRRCRFVLGTEVRPSRALEAWVRWEQRFERWTRDIVSLESDGIETRARRRERFG
jgi:hypothetical protein